MAEISAPTLAKKWGVSRSHIYNLVNRQHDPIPHSRVGQRITINEAEARMWRDRQTRAAHAA